MPHSRNLTWLIASSKTGVTRYFSVQTSLVKGTFPVARLTPALIAIMLSVLVTLTFGILLAGKSEVGKG